VRSHIECHKYTKFSDLFSHRNWGQVGLKRKGGLATATLNMRGNLWFQFLTNLFIERLSSISRYSNIPTFFLFPV
jgi:hypothetical protein